MVLSTHTATVHTMGLWFHVGLRAHNELHLVIYLVLRKAGDLMKSCMRKQPYLDFLYSLYTY